MFCEFTNLGCSDRARGDDVRRHSQWTKFNGNAVRQSVDARFGDRDVGLEGHCPVVDRSADEDDPSTGAGGRGFDWYC